MVRTFSKVSLVSEPSSTFHYSNVNYQILGLVIEKVSGLSYSQYLQDSIFKKLDMKNSFASLNDIDEKNIIQGHRLWFGKSIKSDFPFSRVMLPAGYIISTVEDMSSYLIAHVNNGNFKDKQIFESSIIKQIQTPSATIIKDKIHYGFGWFIDTSSETYLNHLGSTPGYTSLMIIYPKEKLGVIVLTNVTSYSLGNKELNSLAGGIIDIVRNKEIKNSEIDIVSISTYLFFIGLLIVQLYLFNRFIKKLKSISKYKLIILYAFDILISISLYFIVPRIFDLTFNGFLIFVPDIGYLMMASIILSILGLIGKTVIYNKKKGTKKGT
ncbi:MAG: serine hydrolase [Arcobacter sp.]|nr:serine hydrolase [Arcobacter sp.]